MFASDSGLDDLHTMTDWAMDGTFKTSPAEYYQLYVIHIQKGSFSCPRVFALLPNKQQVTYDRVFVKLKELRPLLNPSSLIIDFEKASYNSFTEAFPDAEITGPF